MALRPTRPKSRSDQLAERQAAQNDVFMREVDDALRQDEMMGLVRRYGLPVGAVIAAGLLGLAGWLWWEHSGRQSAGETGEKITMAIDRLEAGHAADADKELAPIAAEGGGSATVAKLLRAGIALEQNRRAEAVKLFAEVSEDKAAAQPFRDLATIRQVAIGFDAMQPQQVVDRLKPLAVPGNAWFGSAGELVGLAYLKQGRKDLAGPLFASIAKDKQVPESLRRRARQMAGVLGFDAIEDVNQAAAGDAPAAVPAATQ